MIVSVHMYLLQSAKLVELFFQSFVGHHAQPARWRMQNCMTKVEGGSTPLNY